MLKINLGPSLFLALAAMTTTAAMAQVTITCDPARGKGASSTPSFRTRSSPPCNPLRTTCCPLSRGRALNG